MSKNKPFTQIQHCFLDIYDWQTTKSMLAEYMNTPLHEVRLCVSLPVTLSLSGYFLLSACAVISLWDGVLCLSLLTCMQSNQWICCCMNDRHRGFCLQREDRAYLSPPLPACLSNHSVQASKKSCGWASFCQLWSVSIISLLLLQSHLSSFVRSITFGWFVAFMHQREAVISPLEETVEGHN